MSFSCAKFKLVVPSHPAQSIFDTVEAERLTACTERASHDPAHSVETSRLLKNASRLLYCALVETGQRAKLRAASVIALDQISSQLRTLDHAADVDGVLTDTVAAVTLLANANDTDDPIEHRRTRSINTADLSMGSCQREPPPLAAPPVRNAVSLVRPPSPASKSATESYVPAF